MANAANQQNIVSQPPGVSGEKVAIEGRIVDGDGNAVNDAVVGPQSTDQGQDFVKPPPTFVNWNCQGLIFEAVRQARHEHQQQAAG